MQLWHYLTLLNTTWHNSTWLDVTQPDNTWCDLTRFNTTRQYSTILDKTPLYATMTLLLHLSSRTTNARGYTPDQRQCRFPDENILERFTEYSHFNCYQEKEIIATEEECGCTSRDITGNFPVCYNSKCTRSKAVNSMFVNYPLHLIWHPSTKWYTVNSIWKHSVSACPKRERICSVQ
jgi:hypothetical protein